MSVDDPTCADAALLGRLLTNRAAVPQEVLSQYLGEWVAWNPEGNAILAHSATSETDVYEQLRAAGHDLGLCCVSYIPDGSCGHFGAALEEELPLRTANGDSCCA